MTASQGATRIKGASFGDTRIKRGSVGTDLFFMLAGISNVQFAGLTADHDLLSVTLEDVLTADITPTRADAVIGMLVNVAEAGSVSTADVLGRLRRGSDYLFASFGWDPRGFQRQLLVDAPGVTSQQTYGLQGRRRQVSDTTAAFAAGSSLMVFELPETVTAGILAADKEAPANVWTEVASVSVTPNSASEKIRLQFVVVLDASGEADVRLLRGSTTLVTAITQGSVLSASRVFPNNIEDWVDSPASISVQTYTIQVRDIAVQEVLAGSFILAEPVE